MHMTEGRPSGRTAAAIFAFLFGIYLFSASGHTYAIDEELMLATTQNLIAHGSFAVNAGGPDTPPTYSGYGPAQSIAAIPFYLSGRALASLFPERAATFVIRSALSWYNPAVTALVGVLIYLVATVLGYRARVAIGTALLYGLATTAWPHSKSFFAEPLTELTLFGSFAFALWSIMPPERAAPLQDPATPSLAMPRLRLLFVSGLLAGLAPLVKIQAGLALPLLGLCVLVALYRAAGLNRRSVGGAVTWGVGAFLVLGLLALYQWLVFGAVGRTGYGTPASLFRNELTNGLYGLLISPGKGIFWYAPPLLLLPFALRGLWRRSWPVAALCSAMIVVNLVFYARLNFWHGDGAWGPRYLNIIMPFLVLPLAAFLDPLAGRETPWRSAALALTLLLAVPVQIGGLAINIDTYLNSQVNWQRRYYNPPDSPIVQHLVMAGRQLRQAYRKHVAPNSLVLLRGFSYSEGNRDAGEQLPRWTLPHAIFALRPPTGSDARLTLGLNGCRPKGAPAAATLRAGGSILARTDACGPRVLHLLLPSGVDRLSLDATPWDPRANNVDRDGPLGVVMSRVQVETDGYPLALQGDLIPVTPVPAGAASLRRWAGDHRFGHWDFWWWYLGHGAYPLAPSLAWAAVWIIVSLGLAAWGGRRIARVFTGPLDGPGTPVEAPARSASRAMLRRGQTQGRVV